MKSDFHDPPAPDQSTLFQWAGGFPALLRLTRRFYEVHVPEDPLLQGCSRRCPPTIPSASPPGSAQVFGGPPAYSEQRGHPRLRMRHAPFVIGQAQADAWLRHMTEK